MAMADGYGLFWNSDSGDRKYDAKSFEKWLKKFFTSGVFEGDLQVLASSGMTVQVQTGYSNLNGKVGLFESATNVTLSAANSRYPRIDTIIIERNDVDRVIQIDKVTGAYTGDNPQPTAPIWDEAQGIYQLVLAQIYVGAGVSSISQEDITDKRTDTDVCGYIAGTVNEMDFSQFTAQFESYFSTFEATQLAEFEEWFDHIKDKLDSDAAGHLQAEVDEINGIIAPVQLTLTASQPYAIGEQFIYDGKLYTAISAIAKDATIVIGTNASLSAEIVKQINAATQSIAQNTTGIAQIKTDVAQNTTDIAANAAGIAALNTGLATKIGTYETQQDNRILNIVHNINSDEIIAYDEKLATWFPLWSKPKLAGLNIFTPASNVEITYQAIFMCGNMRIVQLNLRLMDQLADAALVATSSATAPINASYCTCRDGQNHLASFAFRPDRMLVCWGANPANTGNIYPIQLTYFV